MEKVFCLPFNGDVDFSLNYARKYKGCIHEFYGTDAVVQTARQNRDVSNSDFMRFIESIRGLDIEFNYLLNAIGIQDYLINEDELFAHLSELKNAGVASVTTTHPMYIERLKDMGFTVSASLIQYIDDASDVDWAEYLGYDRIICSDDLNRRYSDLAFLVEYSNLPFEIILNNACLPSCPFRLGHGSYNMMLNSEFDQSYLRKKKSEVKLCDRLWSKDPAFFLKGGWIRPNDAQKYLDIGVRYLKIGGRDFNSAKLKPVLDIYLSGDHDGYVFDYLRPTDSPEARYGVKNIANHDLDQFFEFFFDLETGCKGHCSQCRYCDEYAKKLFC